MQYCSGPPMENYSGVDMRELVELVDTSGYDSLWCGDPISFPMAILEPRRG
jgi:alkanesulfonate monooxygenase SsuD/methylene tetrahydromethanopterin reductase-like flavin-dependent oxidoreductase (luciferase family)